MLLDKDNSLLLLVDVQEKLTPALLNSEAFVERCAWLLKLAHRMQVPVVVSEQYPQGLGSTLSHFQSYYSPDNRIEKVHFSCMQSPAFIKKLDQFNRSQLILIGIEAHVCLLQTAMEMRMSGSEVYVVVDAVSSRTEMDLKYALKRMKQEGIHLITAEMVFFEWLRQAGTSDFKSLSKEFLR